MSKEPIQMRPCIAEVAYWPGFDNPKYFSTCFREKYGVSRTDYLKSK